MSLIGWWDSWSLRVRLTAWYLLVLALVLMVFALSSYLLVASSTRKSTDRALGEMADVFVANVAAEAHSEKRPASAAAKDEAAEFVYRDYEVLVLDRGFREIARSAGPQIENKPGVPSPQFTSAPDIAEVRSVADRASSPETSTLYGTIGGSRITIQPAEIDGQSFLVVVSRPLAEQDAALSLIRRVFYLAVPIALLVAALGGYILARTSLAPIVRMGEQAQRLSSTNLEERLGFSDRSDELGRLARVFNDLLARLHDSFEQQRRFMADASHELRTPVAIIRGEAEVALSRSARPENEYRESLAVVEDEGKRLTRIVADLFTMARADADQLPLVRSSFYLDETIGECLRMTRTMAAAHNLTVHYNPPGEVLFEGDEELIRRLIVNLLENAMKHSPEQGTIRVELEKGEGCCSVAVADEGPGIPEDARHHVFERFYRASADGTGTNGGGAGLGLSIAKWIAEKHGGSLSLKSTGDRGTTFVTTLPLLGDLSGSA